jgi:hypothetical protein
LAGLEIMLPGVPDAGGQLIGNGFKGMINIASQALK